MHRVTAGRYMGRVGVLNLPDTAALITVRVWPPPAAGLAPASRGDLSGARHGGFAARGHARGGLRVGPELAASHHPCVLDHG